MWNDFLAQIKIGNTKSLARCISHIENEVEGYELFMESLPSNNIPVIGITGPPGAGKSTLVDALIGLFVNENKKVAVLCIDPSSAFNLGALLGDRIRMSRWYNEPNVFIRSLATRGSLGGLNPKIIEISDIVKAANFDYIIIETVGVGQSEIEIAGLADVTIVAIVPEAGDEIQTMKTGLMEIADLFVVNKADRDGADLFVRNLQQMLAPAFGNKSKKIEILKTIAHKNKGIIELKKCIDKIFLTNKSNERKYWLLAEKVFFLLQKEKMRGIKKKNLIAEIEILKEDFNLYSYIKKYLN
jgi:LAO/AO transport system kinase